MPIKNSEAMEGPLKTSLPALPETIEILFFDGIGLIIRQQLDKKIK